MMGEVGRPFCQQRQQHLSLGVVSGSLKPLLKVLDVLTIRLASGLALVAAVAVAGGLEPQASAEGGAFRLFTQSNSFVSAFYLSWSETWRTLVRGQLLEAAARTSLPNFVSEF